MNRFTKFIVGLITVIVVLLAYVYRRQLETNRVTAVLAGLLKAEDSAVLDTELRVAVGFGSCVDVISPGLEVLQRIGAVPPDGPEHYDSLHDMKELQRIFAYFFQHGAAAERYMTNATLFDRMTSVAKSVRGTKIAVGGNAPVMVNSLLRHSVKVLLGAQMTDDLKKKISHDVEVAGEKVEDDDIHLILEYKKGDVWGEYTAPRSNRFIVHNDANNPMLSSLEKFGAALKTFSPHLVIVSGLQMLDNFPFHPGQRRERLEVLANILANIPTETHVHFEMASFAEPECLKDIIDTVVRHSDSIGMNEQELPNLLGLLTTGSITAVADAYPRVATTLDQMRELYHLLRNITDNNSNGGDEGKLRQRRLTRLHVHTLAFQAILIDDNLEGRSTWKNNGPAAARSSLAASRHTCGDRQVAVSRSRLLLDESFSVSAQRESRRVELQPEQPVSCWNELSENYGATQICLAPVLVCTNVVQTVGGGDNISTAGIVVQL